MVFLKAHLSSLLLWMLRAVINDFARSLSCVLLEIDAQFFSLIVVIAKCFGICIGDQPNSSVRADQFRSRNDFLVNVHVRQVVSLPSVRVVCQWRVATLCISNRPFYPNPTKCHQIKSSNDNPMKSKRFYHRTYYLRRYVSNLQILSTGKQTESTDS